MVKSKAKLWFEAASVGGELLGSRNNLGLLVGMGVVDAGDGHMRGVYDAAPELHGGRRLEPIAVHGGWKPT